MKVDQLRKEIEEREMEKCTFQPRTNHKNVPVRVLYDWFCKNEDADVKQFKIVNPLHKQNSSDDREYVKRELSPGQKNLVEQKVYVQENLYKPKFRQDRTAEEIEYENNKSELTFKPTFYTKQNKRKSPIRGIQPKSQNKQTWAKVHRQLKELSRGSST